MGDQWDMEYHVLEEQERRRDDQDRFEKLPLKEQIKILEEKKQSKKREEQYHKKFEEYSAIISVCEYLSKINMNELSMLRKYIDRSQDELDKIVKSNIQKRLDLWNKGYSNVHH
jgi:hypothetical protein